ncbi:Domain protein of unknown function [Phaeobacter inhibens]|uniref:DUF4175 domain-containing protein n=1 Tax=Phaeobacter inhibens TaxID=221822 RepID=UPI000C9B1CC0|nr:DUF4175 domain-containing protein [Phaeobacter inhibens]AUR02329.1 Domain protein of unknown function [Phaeobacter inhibens]
MVNTPKFRRKADDMPAAAPGSPGRGKADVGLPWGAGGSDAVPVSASSGLQFSDPRLARLRWPLRLTWLGLLSERLVRAYWPLLSLVMLALAAMMLGLHEQLPVELVWVGAVVLVLATVAALGFGGWRFTRPRLSDALARLDATVPGHPIAAVLDAQAIGSDDLASQALWHAHQQRMQARAAAAKAPKPNLSVARADPFALRYLAMLALAVALLFGSIWRVGTLGEMTPGAVAAATGPTWEGWIEPPRYTGLPVLYLNDQTETALSLPENSRLTLRFYGEVGDLTLDETISGRVGDLPSAAAAEQSFDITRDGTLAINGAGGRSWDVTLLKDLPPSVGIIGDPTLESDDTTSLAYTASDDYGVAGGQVEIALDMEALDRRHGLAVTPDARAPIVLDLPLPLSGDRRAFDEQMIETFAKHPWANMPVTYRMLAQDAAGQEAQAEPLSAPLVTRRFFDPMAAAVAEQRRDLLWARANAPRVAQILRTLSTYPAEVFRDHGDYLRLRTILRRLEQHSTAGTLGPDQQDDLADALWDLAIQLEEGDVGDALARMERAQEQLSQAMRDGASEEEIARLMQQLRDATQDYLRQLQRQAQEQGNQGEQQGAPDENAMQLTQQDLQAMMDRIQELMEQGRMAEAEQALREFQQMMENMRVTEGQQGQDGSPGEQSMDGLADTLREQQGLSDQAFRDLQEQFNPGARRGESDGNEGRNGGLGRGQSHEGGQGNQGGQGDRPGAGNPGGERQPGQGGQGQRAPDAEGGQGGDDATQPGGGRGLGSSLADRQQALRDQLRAQREGLPLGNGEGDQATRDALDDAGRAMDGAEEALRQGDLAEAIDRQSDAMEALREGMRALGEAMAEQQQPGQQQGQGRASTSAQGNRMDPLGRRNGEQGDGGVSDGQFSEGQAYRRAWDLLEEIRRRAGERSRSETERSYLERLLDRF